MILASRAAWAANMKALHREAAGALQIWPILLTDVPPLLAEASEGNSHALKLLLIINDALAHMQTAAPGQGPICACCSGELHASDFAFVVALPAGQPKAQRALTMAICDKCGTDRETVRVAGFQAVKASWPDAREIDITHTEGGRE